MPIQLARIAIEEHLADATQVAEAERHAEQAGEPLVVALVEVAHVSDAALARTLARRLGVVLVGLLEPEADALREVTPDLARRHRVLPLALEVPLHGPRVLRLATADPTDREAIALLEASTGCRIEAVLASLGAIDDAIARAYRGFVTVVMQRAETEPSPPPMEVPPAREPFGGELPGVSTQPFHQIDEEAPVELRLRALVQLLEEKGLLGEDEWLERIRLLLQQRE